MLDPKLLREHLDQVVQALSLRGYQFDIDTYRQLEEKRKQCQVETEKLQNLRNVRSKEIGKMISEGKEVISQRSEMEEIAGQLKQQENDLEEIQAQVHRLLSEMPNIPHTSVPKGNSEEDNVEIRKWGEPREFDFEVKDHVTLGEDLKLMDFASAAKISGARFVVLYQHLARLQRALIQFMLDLHTSAGYVEVYVPYLVKSSTLYGTGQLPKFGEDLFHVKGESELSLIPTAEVPVTNLVRDQIIASEQLPLKFVAHTPCFRSEAGSYGRDTRGMIRQHQFEKIELVQIVKPETSYETLEELTRQAESVLQSLELPYRVMALCTGDLGAISTKTYDLEVWMPSQNKYREISSCSNFEAFHARRMNARFKDGNHKPEFVHTLNGSGLAVGRTLVAIMENYQDREGKIHIPKVLQPYLGGLSIIG